MRVEGLTMETLPDFIAYPFHGPNWEARWLKMVLLLSLLGVVTPFAGIVERGIAFQVMRQVLREGGEAALPENLPWRQTLLDGLRWWAVDLVYHLPAWLVVAVTGGLLVQRYGLPPVDPTLKSVPVWPGLTQGWPLLTLGLALAVLLGMLGGWLGNIAILNTARRDAFRAAFSVGEWGRVLADHLGDFLKALLWMILIGVVLSLAQLIISIPAALLIVLPVLVNSFFSLYQRLISAALYALTYRGSIS